MREVPKKNYAITFFIVFATVVVTLVVANSYRSQIKKTSLMYDYLSEIKINDLDSYLLENPSVVIYIADKYDLEKEEQEIKFKNEINEFNVYNYFIYLDVNDIDDSFIKNFSKEYNFDMDINNLPLLVVINDGKVIDSFNNLNDINITNITEDIK